MMTELMLVEGVSDVQLISYYLQSVYGWKYIKYNSIGIGSLDKHDHIESLFKGDNELIICGVGGKERLAHFVEQHRINSIITECDISSLIVVTDRDEDSIFKIKRRINSSLRNVSLSAGEWCDNTIKDSFGQEKHIVTYLLIIPTDKTGALENVIIDALKDIPEETALIQEVIRFVDSLKEEIVPQLIQANNADKATVGTFFSIREPKHTMRSFAMFISKIDWSKSESLNELFLPFKSIGEQKQF